MTIVLGLFGKKAEAQAQKVWKCPHCNMTFDEKERMKRHVRKAHGEKGGDMPRTNPFGFS